MSKKLLLLTFLFIYIQSISIDSTKNFLLDNEGRPMILHGVNVVVKLPPYIPNTEKFDPAMSFSDEDISILKKLGINFIRLGFIWEALEKKEGEYDYEYLNKMSEIVDKLEKNDFYVLIDTHQDMFSRTLCGEGAPTFYANKLTIERKCESNLLSRFFKLVTACIPLSDYNWNYDEQGLPLIEDCKNKGLFMDYHRSPELASIYDSFYKNENGVLDAFTEYWAVLAEKFKGRKNVIGFDIWNEPWPNNLWSDIRSLIPGYVDDKYVNPMYKKINERIEKVDPNYILFYQPVPFPDNLPLFGGWTLSSFSTPPVDPEERPQVFNVHDYCCLGGASVCRKGEPNLDDAKNFCPGFHKSKLSINKKQAQDLNAPLIVTEFGACSASEACYYEMLGFVQPADENLVSWAYWMYKGYHDHTTTAQNETEGIFNSDGTIMELKKYALSRSYVQKFQGYPLYMNFNDETKELTAKFYLNSSLEEGTVIYVNKELNYPNGYEVFVDSDEKDRVINFYINEYEDNYITFYIHSDTNYNVNIRIVAK